jgi:hypothetical protein
LFFLGYGRDFYIEQIFQIQAGQIPFLRIGNHR